MLSSIFAIDATDFGWKSMGLNKGVFSLAYDPDDSNVIYAGTLDDGLYRSTDSGQSWTHIWGDEWDQVRAIAIGPESKTIYLGVALGSNVGIWASYDGGATWMQIDTGLGVRFIQTLVMHPTNDQILYAGTGWGVIKTEDGGQTWINASEGLAGETGDFPWVHSLVIDPTDPDVLYICTETAMLFRPAAVPKQVSEPHPFVTESYLTSRDVIPNVFVSEDGGSSWKPIELNIEFPLQFCFSVSIDPKDPNQIYLGTLAGIIKTVETKYQFELVDQNLPSTAFPIKMICDTSNGTVYACTLGNGVFQSKDKGQSWSQIFSFGWQKERSSVSALLFDPTVRNKIVVGGLYNGDIYQKTLLDSLDRHDFNEDGAVNFDDFTLFAKNFNLNISWDLMERRFDLDRSGKVDFADFLIFVKAFLQSN